MSENIIARGCLKYDLYVVNLDEAREKQASGPLTLEQTQGIVVKWMEAGQPCSQGEDGEWSEDENGCSIDGEHVLVTAGLPCGGPIITQDSSQGNQVMLFIEKQTATIYSFEDQAGNRLYRIECFDGVVSSICRRDFTYEEYGNAETGPRMARTLGATIELTHSAMFSESDVMERFADMIDDAESFTKHLEQQHTDHLREQEGSEEDFSECFDDVPPAPEQIGNAWDEEDAEPAAEVKPETMVVYYRLAGGKYFGRRATKRQHHFFMEGCASFGIRPFSSIMGDSAAKIYPDMDWSTVAITDVAEDAFASLIEDVIDEARFADEEE